MSTPRTKEFHTQCQEEVYRQVKGYLDELVDEHFDDADHCDFYLKYGSTVLEISIDAYEEDDAVISVLAFCVQGVDPTFELMQELLLGIWERERKTVLFVTHDIDEAVYLADRVIVLAGSPAGAAAEIRVAVAAPRQRRDPGLLAVARQLRTELSTNSAAL